jgi:hypothetical protein
MEKMFDINPDSEILKVMAVRSINELERSYLPTYYYTSDSYGRVSVYRGNTENHTSKEAASDKTTTEAKEVKEEKISFWQKIVRFFKNLFGGSKSDSSATGSKTDQSDDELLNNPNRIPFTRPDMEAMMTKPKIIWMILKNSLQRRKRNQKMNTGRLQMLILNF